MFAAPVTHLILYHNFFLCLELEDGPSHSEVLPPSPANKERETYKQLGLTKEVLVAHTQREESDFLTGFMDSKKLSAFQTRCNSYMYDRPGGKCYLCKRVL